MDDFLTAGGSIRAVPVRWCACGVGENVTSAKGVTQQMSNPDDPVYCGTCILSDVFKLALNQVQMARHWQLLASRRGLKASHANLDVDKLTCLSCYRDCLYTLG